MKNFKTLMAGIAMFTLLFTSCSKEENTIDEDQQTATLTFGTALEDFNKANMNKQQADVGECIDGDPAFAQITMEYGDANTEVAVVVPVLEDDNGYFTAYHESMEIPVASGETHVSVTLMDFVVWTDDDGDGNPDNVLWVAPKVGSDYAHFVTNPIGGDASTWNLRAGSKTYLDVEVLCFDDRDVNLYGYQFFDIVPKEMIEFCVFGNYCDENGRHYAAQYSVDVWMYSNGQRGEQIHTGLENVVEDMVASPLCLALPDSEGTDEYYFEITLMDGEDYNVTERVVRAGVITDDEVKIFFDGEENVNYYHFNTGCDNDDNVPILRDPQDDAMFYKATLSELNDSDAYGFAYLRLDGNILETAILAYGTTPNMIHPQHIHGFADDSVNGTCPPESASGDDQYITLGEGAPFYGPPMLFLMQENGTWPEANAWGMYSYSRTFTLGSGGTISADDLMALENRVIVLHGMFVPDGALGAPEDQDDDTDPDYIATLPIACGQIWEVNL